MRDKRESREVCSIDKTGNANDARLHESILYGIDPDAEQRVMDATRKDAAAKYGFAPEQIKKLFG